MSYNGAWYNNAYYNGALYFDGMDAAVLAADEDRAHWNRIAARRARNRDRARVVPPVKITEPSVGPRVPDSPPPQALVDRIAAQLRGARQPATVQRRTATNFGGGTDL